jgi:thymidylate synthase (FAD)
MSNKDSNIKVTLLSYTKEPLAIIAAAINQCYSVKSGAELTADMPHDKRVRLLKQVLSSGHTSTIEHASFTFSVENVSRITEVQLVRHRLASYSIKSGRYNPSHTNFVVPAKIAKNETAMVMVEELRGTMSKFIDVCKAEGIEFEDIRYLMPQGTRTNIMVTMNARALLHFFEERMCSRAQWEIRTLANLMHKEVMTVLPELFEFAGPSCKSEGICWQTEKMSCGLWQTIGAERKDRVVL